MTVKLFASILFVFASLPATTCTTFILKTETELVFGRNLDWVSNNGIIVINQRNVSKKSLVISPEVPIKWISKYGSVTFNQFGKEFPYGGINEKGLVVEIMIAPAQYENFDGRKAINELQWVQFQLDNSETIDDVLKTKTLLRISALYQELHYLVCDRFGNAAVIEFQNNKMMVYRKDKLPIPVLENDLYKISLTNYKNRTNCRFCETSEMIENFEPGKENAIDYSFKILENVALSAEWSIVYDIKKMNIYFKTSTNRNIRKIDIGSFDFDCSKKVFAYDLQSIETGLINKNFILFSSVLNKSKLKDAIKTNKMKLPKSTLKILFDFHKSCYCK